MKTGSSHTTQDPADPAVHALLEEYAAIILSADKTVVQTRGRMMSIDHAYLFSQEGAFKYALTRTKNHFSFHSMVMYGFPAMMDGLREKLPRLIFQKGCMNFKTREDLPPDAFREFVARSAAIDYLAVIDKYQSKKRK